MRMSISVRSNLLPQKPLASMSSRAPSSEMAEEAIQASPERGCRCGSTRTSWHTSVSRRAVRSRTSLRRSIGKPPLWHERLCLIEKLEPHSQ